MDDDREKSLNIALNKISGEWDEEKLAVLLEELQAAKLDHLTGFDPGEIEALTEQFCFSEDDAAGDIKNNEINLGSFDEVNFTTACPRCGFCFNPKKNAPL